MAQQLGPSALNGRPIGIEAAVANDEGSRWHHPPPGGNARAPLPAVFRGRADREARAEAYDPALVADAFRRLPEAYVTCRHTISAGSTTPVA
jgi:hypothetical protein